MTNNINKETTNNHVAKDTQAKTETNTFPTMPTIASDSPWLNAYERYGIDATIDMPMTVPLYLKCSSVTLAVMDKNLPISVWVLLLASNN